MSTSESTATEPRNATRCADCDAPLAHDQRYCVECGTRRGPLPAQIAALIGAIREQGPSPDLPPGTPLADSLSEADRRPPAGAFAMPGPRAAAVAVMGMLAFGVIVGSLVGGTSVETLASAPLIVVGLGHPATTPAARPWWYRSRRIGRRRRRSPLLRRAAARPQRCSRTTRRRLRRPRRRRRPRHRYTSAGLNGLPPVKHVFLIVLSDRGFTQSFGGSSGYLSGALRRQGELVQNYYAVAGAPLANEIALVSGQGPTVQTATDCPVFSHIKPATKGARGQVIGSGCAYPAATKTLAGQLSSAGDTWKAYVQGVPSTAKSACRVPKVGSKVPQVAGSKNAYLAWRNPFLYFRSMTERRRVPQQRGRPRSAWPSDLKSASTTPTLSYVIPAPCNDGSEAPCTPDAATGLAAANRFLKSVVPEIKRSPAYKDGGMIAITFDQAPQTGQYADPSACCASPASYPNLRGLPAGTPAAPPGAMGTTTPGTATTGTTTTDTTTAPATTTTTDTTTTATTTTTDTTTPRRHNHRHDDHRHDHHAGNDHTTDTTTTPATTTTAPVSLGSGETTPTGGGGQVGLLLISPYVKAEQHRRRRLLQPLLAAGDDREHVRAAPAGLRRRSRAPDIQHRRVQQLRRVAS